MANWRSIEYGIEKVYRPGLAATVAMNIPSGKYFAVIHTGPELKGVAAWQGGFNFEHTAQNWADEQARRIGA